MATGINDSPNRILIINHLILCCNQIKKSLFFLEKIVNQEKKKSICLTAARQCFFERVLWCLARLRSTINSSNDHIICEQLNDPTNFVCLIDDILGNLSCFITLDDEKNITNKAERRAELMLESREIQEDIKNLLSLTLTFSNMASVSDKNLLATLSQNVFKVAQEFTNEFSLSNSKKNHNISSQRMKSIELETALYHLENAVNNGLLRLVFDVFFRLNRNPIEYLQSIKDKNVMKNEIDKFDILIERLLQIGQFAISFCKDDSKILSILKSCLASIESLDTYLIPSLTTNCIDPSINILKEHFNEECKELQINIHHIIDTKAFCTTLMDLLIEEIEVNQKKFDKKSLVLIMEYGSILLDHLLINPEIQKLMEDKVIKFCFNDYKLILQECEAIMNFNEQVDDYEKRVLKRFNILKNTIKKLISAIKNNQNDDFEENEKPKLDIIKQCEEVPSDFKSIRPSGTKSFLYESKRSMKYRPIKADSSLKKPTKHSNSLRIAMFKKKQFKNELEIEESMNESMDLQITEILDKLSDLSTTLTNN